MSQTALVPAESTLMLFRHLHTMLRKLEQAVERAPLLSFGVLTLFYLCAVLSLSWMKLLWLDELITLHIAKLNTIHDIWIALGSGADPNPPTTHILVHLCRSLFGEREAALRLPAIVGYWIGATSLFVFLRRRMSPVWSIAGVVLSMTMAAFDYSFESRSYGIFYGLAMLAFLCWTISVDSPPGGLRRNLALGGMVFALAAGIATNYFAVLAFFPIAAGEFTLLAAETGALSRVQPLRFRQGLAVAFAPSHLRIWSALILSASPLLVFRKMISRSIAQFAPHAWNKVSIDQVFDSYTEMVEVVLYPILLILLLSAATVILSRLCTSCKGKLAPVLLQRLTKCSARSEKVLPAHEAVGTLFFMAYPILGYCVASVRGGMLSPRFVIPVCFGFAVAGTIAAFHLFGHKPQAGVWLLCFLLAWFIAREGTVGYWYMEQKQCFYKVLDRLPEAEVNLPPGNPIAISDPLMALTFQHYAPAEYAQRVVFPIDFAAIRFYRHDDSPEENIWAGKDSLYTLRVLPVAFFQRDAGLYLILASDRNWFVEDLRFHRYPVKRLAINTRAGAIGGFTPLSHGVPVFFTSSGDQIFNGIVAADLAPVPFTLPGNLPDETLSARN